MTNDKNIKLGSPEDSYYSFKEYEEQKSSWETKREQEKAKKVTDVQTKKPENNGDVFVEDSLTNLAKTVNSTISIMNGYELETKKFLGREDVTGLKPSNLTYKFLTVAAEKLKTFLSSIELYLNDGLGLSTEEYGDDISVRFVLRKSYVQVIDAEWMSSPKQTTIEYKFELLSIRIPKSESDRDDVNKWVEVEKQGLDDIITRRGVNVNKLNLDIERATEGYTVRWLLHYYSSLKRNVAGLDSDYKPVKIDWKKFTAIYYRPVVQIEYGSKVKGKNKKTELPKNRVQKDKDDKDIDNEDRKVEKYNKEKSTYAIDDSKETLLALLDKLESIDAFFNEFMNVVDYDKLLKEADKCFGDYVDTSSISDSLENTIGDSLENAQGDMDGDMIMDDTTKQLIDEYNKDITKDQSVEKTQIPTISFDDNIKVYDPSGGIQDAFETSLKSVIKNSLIASVKQALGSESGISCDTLKRLIDDNTWSRFKDSVTDTLNDIKNISQELLSETLEGVLQYAKQFMNKDVCITPDMMISMLDYINESYTPEAQMSLLEGTANQDTINMAMNDLNRIMYSTGTCDELVTDVEIIEYVFNAVGSDPNWFGPETLEELDNIIESGSDMDVTYGAKIKCTNAYDRLRNWLANNGYDEDYIDCIVSTDTEKKEAGKEAVSDLQTGDFRDNIPSQEEIVNSNMISNQSFQKILKEIFDVNYRPLFIQYKNLLSYWVPRLSKEDYNEDKQVDFTSNIPNDDLPEGVTKDDIKDKYFTELEYSEPPELETADEANAKAVLKQFRGKFSISDLIFDIVDNNITISWEAEEPAYSGSPKQYNTKRVSMNYDYGNGYSVDLTNAVLQKSEFEASYVGTPTTTELYSEELIYKNDSTLMDSRTEFGDRLYSNAKELFDVDEFPADTSVRDYIYNKLYDKILFGMIQDYAGDVSFVGRNKLKGYYVLDRDSRGLPSATADGFELFSNLLKSVESIDCIKDKCNIFNSDLILRDSLLLFTHWAKDNLDSDSYESDFMSLANTIVQVRIYILEYVFSNLYSTRRYDDFSTDHILINRLVKKYNTYFDGKGLDITHHAIFGQLQEVKVYEDKLYDIIEYDLQKLIPQLNILLIHNRNQRFDSLISSNLPIWNFVGYTDDMASFNGIYQNDTSIPSKSSSDIGFITNTEGLFYRMWYMDGDSRVLVGGTKIEELDKSFLYIDFSDEENAKTLSEIYNADDIVHFDLCYGVFDYTAGVSSSTTEGQIKYIIPIVEDIHSCRLQSDGIDTLYDSDGMVEFTNGIFDAQNLSGIFGLFVSDCVRITTDYDDLFEDMLLQAQETNEGITESMLNESIDSLVDYDFESMLSKSVDDNDTFGLLKSFRASNSIEKMASKMALDTAKLIFKGVVEQSDPNIRAARTLVDLAKITGKNIPITVASLGILYPTNITPPFGWGPPITPAGFGYLALETGFETKSKVSESLDNSISSVTGESDSTVTDDSNLEDIEFFDIERICREYQDVPVYTKPEREEPQPEEEEDTCQLPQLNI